MSILCAILNRPSHHDIHQWYQGHSRIFKCLLQLNMRTPSKYIASFFTITFLTACLLWFPNWPPGSPPTRITAATTESARALYTPFVLVHFYRQRSSYQAPLYQNGEIDDEAPPYYEVLLHPGYSMAEHKRFVGADVLQGQIRRESPEIKGYIAELDETVLHRVRADVGVDEVRRLGVVTADV
jgi:hypothetical protein